jgi:hypothetical protein
MKTGSFVSTGLGRSSKFFLTNSRFRNLTNPVFFIFLFNNAIFGTFN